MLRCAAPQMARLRANRLDFAAAKGMSAVSKDADMSPFTASSRLFDAARQGDTANPPRCGFLDCCQGEGSSTVVASTACDACMLD
jgi:hypothetical protein